MKRITLIISMMILMISYSSMATTINDSCPHFTCETVEINETRYHTTTEETVSYYSTEVVTEHTITNWSGTSGNNQGNNQGNGHRINNSNVIRHWNKDGTCSVTMDRSDHPSWHDRWSSNYNIIITGSVNQTTYQINDINECAFYLDALMNGNGNRNGNRNGNSNGNRYWSEVVKEISLINTMFISYITTTDFYNYHYFSTICSLNGGTGGGTGGGTAPVPELPTMILFGVGILSILITKQRITYGTYSKEV